MRARATPSADHLRSLLALVIAILLALAAVA